MAETHRPAADRPVSHTGQGRALVREVEGAAGRTPVAQRLPVCGVTLSDPLITLLVQRREPQLLASLRSVLAATSAKVVLLGEDRFRPGIPGLRIDPLFTAQWFLSRFPEAAALVTTSPEVEHPFNYARRTLALDHFTAGRLGVVVGGQDLGSGFQGGGLSPWTGSPSGPWLATDFIGVLRKLWNSWPVESIIADKDHGVFADSSQIVKIQHDGAYTVRGPVNAPSSVQGEPPLGWRLSGDPREGEHTGGAEFLIVEDGAVADDIAQSESLHLIPAGVDRLDHMRERARHVPSSSIRQAVLLRLDSPAEVAHAAKSLGTIANDDAASARSLGTARQRLGIAPRRLDISGFEAAFSAENSVKGSL